MDAAIFIINMHTQNKKQTLTQALRLMDLEPCYKNVIEEMTIET